MKMVYPFQIFSFAVLLSPSYFRCIPRWVWHQIKDVSRNHEKNQSPQPADVRYPTRPCRLHLPVGRGHGGAGEAVLSAANSIK